jgi:hypothetical protein
MYYENPLYMAEDPGAADLIAGDADAQEAIENGRLPDQPCVDGILT